MPILRKTEIFEEFVMEKKIIYLKAEQSSYVNHGKIHIGDIASVFCEDKEIEKKIKNIVLYEFDEKNEKEGRVFLSILLLIEKFRNRFRMVKFEIPVRLIWLSIIKQKS